jgi:ABC-type sugar transport system substrate-binding protein
MKISKKFAVIGAAGLVLALAACSSPATSSTKVSGSGTLSGKGKTIVAFLVSTANSYVGADAKALQAEATRLGYGLKIVQNNFNQTQEDQQVRQFLSSGQKAAAFVYWPATAGAGINSARLLSQQAPVFQMNAPVLAKEESYITAYAGADQVAIGEAMGRSALADVKAQKAAGVVFHGADGKPNLLTVTFPVGYQAGIDRETGFNKIVGNTFNVLDTEHGATPDAQGGFTAASQILPKDKSENIDFVLAGSNNIGAGVVKALIQNGITPGKDVQVIAGDFSGDKQPLISGQIYSAVLQSPSIEGRLVIDTVAKYLATGKVTNTTVHQAISDQAPKLDVTPPAKTTYMPVGPITLDNYKQYKVWGLDINQLEF